MTQIPNIILRQITNGIISQCYFLSSLKFNPFNGKHNLDYFDLLLATSDQYIYIFELKTRRIVLKLRTNHESSILSCIVIPAPNFEKLETKLIENKFNIDDCKQVKMLFNELNSESYPAYIITWSRDGHLESQLVDLKRMIHIGMTHRFQIGKEASFCKWAFDTSESLIYIPHSNEECIEEVKFEFGLFTSNCTYYPYESETKSTTDSNIESNIETDSNFDKVKRGMIMSLATTNKFIICAWESGRISFLNRSSSSKAEYFHIVTIEEDIHTPPQPITEILPFTFKYDESCKDFWKTYLNEKSLNNIDLIAVGSSSNIVNIFHIESKNLVKQFKLPFKGGINSLQFTSNRFMIAAGWDYRIHIWDIKRLKQLGSLRFHLDSVNCINVLQKNEFLLDELLNNEKSKENLEKLTNSTSSKSDNIIFCSSSEDHRIAIWNLNFKSKSK